MAVVTEPLLIEAEAGLRQMTVEDARGPAGGAGPAGAQGPGGAAGPAGPTLGYPTYIQATQPTAAGPWAWIRTDRTPRELWIEDGLIA